MKEMYILDKIETLRDEKTPNEIEDMLLNGELGEIGTSCDRYQYIGDLAVSWLVIEAHEPGFVEWMSNHPNKNVVHHKDKDILNNAYLNLQVMSRGDHASLHVIAWHKDKVNAEFIKAKGKEHSDWFKDRSNAEAIRACNAKHSKTCEEKRTVPGTLGEFFTVREFAKANKVNIDTASSRVAMLFRDGKVACKEKFIDGYWCNLYKKEELK